MALSRDTVDHVAMLARLGLSEEERERLREELSAIIDHVSQLEQVDTSSVAPTAQVGDLVNAWREDESRPSLTVARALQNAPEREADYFTVGAIQE